MLFLDTSEEFLVTTSVIVAGARTPMGGRLQGALKDFSGGSDLGGGVAIAGALAKAGGVAPESVEYVIMGQVLTAGAGQIPARQPRWRRGFRWMCRR